MIEAKMHDASIYTSLGVGDEGICVEEFILWHGNKLGREGFSYSTSHPPLVYHTRLCMYASDFSECLNKSHLQVF